MASAFSDRLRLVLDNSDLTQREFAQAVGRSLSFISKVLNDHRPPPADLETWADVLGLAGEAYREFLELGYLPLTPKFIRDEYIKLKKGRS